jgi:hypothetical protein
MFSNKMSTHLVRRAVDLVVRRLRQQRLPARRSVHRGTRLLRDRSHNQFYSRAATTCSRAAAAAAAVWSPRAAPPPPTHGGRLPPRVRPHRRFRNRRADSLSESGMKWMRGGAKRQCDRADPHRRSPSLPPPTAARRPPPAAPRASPGPHGRAAPPIVGRGHASLPYV